jgi:hypothetical protein
MKSFRPPIGTLDDLVEALLDHGNDGRGIEPDDRDDARRQLRRLLRACDDVTDTAPPGLSAAELTARVRARCPDVSYPFTVVEEEVNCDGEPVHSLSIHLPHRLRDPDRGCCSPPRRKLSCGPASTATPTGRRGRRRPSRERANRHVHHARPLPRSH